MPSIYDLKPGFQSMLRPITHRLASAGVSANNVTISAIVLSVATGVLLSLFPETFMFLLIPFALFIRMALNAIDGMLAREHNMTTPLGAVLNELGDVVSDAALYLPFALLPGLNPIWVILVVILSNVSEMTGVIAIQIGGSRRYDGPMGKSDRAFLFGLLALIIGLEYNILPWLDFIFIATSISLLLTIFNRSHAAIHEIKTQ